MGISKKEIKLIKNHSKRDWIDIQWVDEFYKFLQGEIPDTIQIKKPLKLSPEQAFTVIWYLQEHFSILPDDIEQCDVCTELYDSGREGIYDENGNEYGRSFCGACDHLAPYEETQD